MPLAEAEHVVEVRLDDQVVQGAGVIQGGVLTGVLGEAVDTFSARVVEGDCAIELETIDVTFERAALPGSFSVHASLLRKGRTLLAWEARLVDADGRVVASARTTHRVVPQRR